MDNHAIQKAFEIYHLHGASSVKSMSDHFGCTEEHLTSEIMKFGASLTEPYQIKSGEHVIKTVDPVPVLKMVQGSIIEPTRQLNNQFEFKQIKMKVVKTPIDPTPRTIKTDAEGYMRVKVGDTVVRVKPEDFFAPTPDIKCMNGIDVGELLTKELTFELEHGLVYYTDEEIRAEFIKRGLTI